MIIKADTSLIRSSSIEKFGDSWSHPKTKNILLARSVSRQSTNSVFFDQSSLAQSTAKLARRQWMILITLAYGNFWIAACVSLQAPFFPQEAEKKGATPTVYGLIFGIYELVILIFSPIFGKLIALISPAFMVQAGLFLAGATTVAFGTLDLMPSGACFISYAFLIRILEGIGAAGFLTASYTIMAAEFPDNVATTFALLETCFGLGLILGPTVGGALYSSGGYPMPFLLLGSFMVLGGILAIFILPSSDSSDNNQSGDMLKFLKDAGILLDIMAIATCMHFIGYNAATLEPHLRLFKFSPVEVGSIFIITGSIYAFTSPLVGKMVEYTGSPKSICLIGSLFICLGVTFIGPLPIFPFDKEPWLIIFSLILIGIGISCKMVSAYLAAITDTIKRRGFPDDMGTYGLVSAMFFCSSSIGAFAGPSIGGLLLDSVGYRHGTYVLLAMDGLLSVMLFAYIIKRRCCGKLIGEKSQLIKSQKCALTDPLPFSTEKVPVLI